VRLGTSARSRLLDARAASARRAAPHLSIVGSEFTGRVVGDADVAAPGGRHGGRGHGLPHGRAEFTPRPGRPARRGIPACGRLSRGRTRREDPSRFPVR
jgi:hypothetical protein